MIVDTSYFLLLTSYFLLPISYFLYNCSKCISCLIKLGKFANRLLLQLEIQKKCLKK